MINGDAYMKKECIQIFDIKITGYEKEYVFETIKKNGYFYEGPLLDKWTKYFQDAKVIFDIGANLGNHSLYWASTLNCEKVYSFEPFKPNFDLLKENIEKNKLNQIIPFNMGVGDGKAKAILKSFDESNYGATTLEEVDLSNQQENANTMDIVDIDSFVRDNEIEKVDFVKIDTEGFEEKVISGMMEVITKFKPALWIEVSPQSYKNVFQILNELEYVVVDIEGFNVLLMQKDKVKNLKVFGIEKALSAMFQYLEKVNVYYNNYIKTKEWLNEKNEKITTITENYNTIKQKNEDSKKRNEELIKNYQEIKKRNEKLIEDYQEVKKHNEEIAGKYKTVNENYQKMKEQYTNERNECLEIKGSYKKINIELDKLKLEHHKMIDKYDNLNKTYTEQLEKDYLSNIEEMKMLKELQNIIKKLETQNNYLKSENTEYQRKMQMIKDTFVGKILVWGYRTMKKIKGKLK